MVNDIPPDPEEPTSETSQRDGAAYGPVRTASHAPDLTLANLIAVVRRRAIPMAITAGVVVVIGVLFTISLTPRYTATSAVLFDAQSQNVLDMNQLLGEQAGPPISIENQIAIITSSTFAGKRKRGMPRAIIPPATDCFSKTVTGYPSRARK